MSHRRFIATAALFAAGLTLIPASAQAAEPAPAKAVSKPVNSKTLEDIKSSGFQTFVSPGEKAIKARAAKGEVSPRAESNLIVGFMAIPNSGRGISLTASVGGNSGSVPVTIAWGDGTTSTANTDAENFAEANHTYAKLGTYTITVTATDASGAVSDSMAITTAGSHYTAYGPTRLLDTRGASIAPGATARLKIAGNGSIPAGVTAAVLNLTVTNPQTGGFITAYPSGGEDPRPTTSNVNFTPGQTVPNLSVVPVGANGYVELYNGSGGTVDVIADIAGYFSQKVSSGFTPISPARLVDTREGVGTTRGQVAGNGSFPVQIFGSDQAPLPGSGVTAVALNVTTTAAKGGGFLTIYPNDVPKPLASNLNFGPGQTIANAVIVPVGADGKIRVSNGSGAPTDVIVDVVGYYSAAGASAYIPIDPLRLLDTREWQYGAVPSGEYIPMIFPAGGPDVTGYVLNSTVTATQADGFLTVAPDPNLGDGSWVEPTRPNVSTLNWTRGQTVPNLVQAPAGPGGGVDFWNASSGSTHMVIDMFGFYDKG
ncbi:hypothetical protein F4556_003330 [Kitasatospora gansuensis]|uniref:PKD domain-containing protein n=2 Tax=Kitasatospora TaxID=2063 RepID=A0A7W7SC69_9ACTN|nr:PKD domain-containing protein [Kitasatospora gansuensis]MBB4947795.1 hypothetical protein [Kitasatospora gansuensis]